jgi:hypothetical protein
MCTVNMSNPTSYATCLLQWWERGHGGPDQWVGGVKNQYESQDETQDKTHQCTYRGTQQAPNQSWFLSTTSHCWRMNSRSRYGPKELEHTRTLRTWCFARLGWKLDRIQFMLPSKRGLHFGRRFSTTFMSTSTWVNICLRVIAMNTHSQKGGHSSNSNAPSSMWCTMWWRSDKLVALALETWCGKLNLGHSSRPPIKVNNSTWSIVGRQLKIFPSEKSSMSHCPTMEEWCNPMSSKSMVPPDNPQV